MLITKLLKEAKTCAKKGKFCGPLSTDISVLEVVGGVEDGASFASSGDKEDEHGKKEMRLVLRIVYPLVNNNKNLMKPCSFTVSMDQDFPKVPPRIKCETLEAIRYLNKAYIDPKNGLVKLEMYEEGKFGFLSSYGLAVLVHSINRLLLLHPDGGVDPPSDDELQMISLSSKSKNSPFNTNNHELKLKSGEHNDQGPRPSMEDAVSIIDGHHIPHKNNVRASFHAVYDGHGGANVSKICSEDIYKLFFEQLGHEFGFKKALYRAVIYTEQKIRKLSGISDKNNSWVKESSGSTACIVSIDLTHKILYCANVGDSRAIMSRNKGSTVYELSYDQRAENPVEIARIAANGGFVSFHRVMGMLAVARAIGDMELKEEGRLTVSAEPEIRMEKLSINDEFIVIACDGVFDVMSSSEVITFVRTLLIEHNLPPKLVAKKLVDFCVYERQSMDNVTAIVIQLNWSEKNPIRASHSMPAEFFAEHHHSTIKTKTSSSSSGGRLAAYPIIKANEVVVLNPQMTIKRKDSNTKKAALASLNRIKRHDESN